jgi:deoxyribonuclease V
MPGIIPNPFSWEVTPQQAVSLQRELRGRVIREDRFQAVRSVAGVDVGYANDGETSRAAVAVLSYPDLELLDQAVLRRPVTFPQIPQGIKPNDQSTP